MNGTDILERLVTNSTAAMVENQADLCEIHASVEHVLFSLFMSIVLLLSLCGNALVVVSIAMSNVLKRRVSSLFIASLACSDFYFALSLIPLKISSFLHGSRFCHSLPTCYWYVMSDSLSNTASIINLLAIALDRFIAIKTPYIYAEKVTKKRATIVIVTIWLFAFACSVIGIFKWNDNEGHIFSIYIGRMCANGNYYFYLVLYFAIYISSLLVISCIYATILHIALSHIRAIETTTTILQQNNNTDIDRDDSIRASGNNGNRKGKSNRRKRELKTTKSLAIVYGTFIVCWLPSCIVNVIMFFNEQFFYSLQTSHPSMFLFVYYTCIEVLPSINTAVNPFIYSFSNTQFRAAFKNVLFKIIGKHINTGAEFNSSVVTDSRSGVRYSSQRFSASSIITRITPNIVLRKLGKSKTLQDIKEVELMRPRVGTL